MMSRSLLSFFLCFSLGLFAQGFSPSAINDTPPTSSAQEKASKKEKNKKTDEADDLNATTFSGPVASVVMRRLSDALEGHNRRLMLSLFDVDKMDDYPGFEGQIIAFFDHYASFRAHIRIVQTTTEGETGLILSDIEMESLPAGEAPPARKHDQLRFELKRGNKGWRIVNLTPRDFFS